MVYELTCTDGNSRGGHHGVALESQGFEDNHVVRNSLFILNAGDSLVMINMLELDEYDEVVQILKSMKEY